jgi:hypothetical protein
MKPTVAQRSEELRRLVADGRRKLDAAIEDLGRVSTARLTLGGRMAHSPWRWLWGAGACGLLIGMFNHPED